MSQSFCQKVSLVGGIHLKQLRNNRFQLFHRLAAPFYFLVSGKLLFGLSGTLEHMLAVAQLEVDHEVAVCLEGQKTEYGGKRTLLDEVE